MGFRGGRALVVIFIVLVASGGRAGAEPREPLTPPVELRHDLHVDGAVTAALVASIAGTYIVRNGIQPQRCRWCDGSNGDVGGLDGWARGAFRRTDENPAKWTSHVIAFGLAPLSIGGLTVLAASQDRRMSGVLTDLLLIAEGSLSAILVTEVLKPIVARPRPYIRAVEDEDARLQMLEDNPDGLRSFPSGHTTIVFGIAAASGAVSSMRGYRLAPLVWATGMMLGVATAYARVAADRHYLTDTLAGAAIGVVVGGGVPLLFHRPTTSPTTAAARWLERTRVGTTPMRGGHVVTAGWIF